MPSTWTSNRLSIYSFMMMNCQMMMIKRSQYLLHAIPLYLLVFLQVVFQRYPISRSIAARVRGLVFKDKNIVNNPNILQCDVTIDNISFTQGKLKIAKQYFAMWREDYFGEVKKYTLINKLHRIVMPSTIQHGLECGPLAVSSRSRFPLSA